MKNKLLLALVLLLVSIPIVYSNPTGTDEYYYSQTAKPINGKTDIAKITKDDLAKQISHNMFSLDFTWALVAGFLVMFMQCGFALVESGFCRRKNAHHVFLMNFLVYPVAGFAFFVIGFAIMMGGSNLFPALNQAFSLGSWNLFGLKGILLAGATYLGVKGIIYDQTLAGGLGQLISQVIGIVAIVAWVSIASLIFHWLSNKLAGIRVSEEDELKGLDVTVHGTPAYNDDE